MPLIYELTDTERVPYIWMGDYGAGAWNLKYNADRRALLSVIGSDGFLGSIILTHHYPKLPYGIRSVDIWYLTKKFATSWPKKQEEYWHDYPYAIGLNDRYGYRWENSKPLNV